MGDKKEETLEKLAYMEKKVIWREEDRKPLFGKMETWICLEVMKEKADGIKRVTEGGVGK